jgi:hypothetical protein
MENNFLQLVNIVDTLEKLNKGTISIKSYENGISVNLVYDRDHDDTNKKTTLMFGCAIHDDQIKWHTTELIFYRSDDTVSLNKVQTTYHENFNTAMAYIKNWKK